ncbi:MAG: hypothetical protein JWO48_3074, partial [Bryobacterales bacterium]|nr:hypothetical protein [Bryobacterales bacterium]
AGRVCIMAICLAPLCVAQPHDPGVRGGLAGAGGPLPGLSAAQLAAFNDGLVAYQEVDDVAKGLGPRFNLDSCAGCHAAPAIGGVSPALNPQVAMATANGARNTIPPFITANGPVREVRFQLNADGTRDGGVHALFTIRGRADARGCNISQPDFSNTANLSFRIPTPNFGAGLIEAIPDSTLKSALASNRTQKARLGISGRLNTTSNDGTVTRFGWKAQNKSLLVFSGEAYNVEQGVTNVVFFTEREENAACAQNATPEDGLGIGASADVIEFANFMRFLAPPAAALATPSTTNGRNLFSSIGCAFCHTPSLSTGNSTVTALRDKPVDLFSDLALHSMGSGLADNISQGLAGPDEFRTAPLWGIGQRIFFLHDGRTTDLLGAIRAHASPGSEANMVIDLFNGLSASQQQDILNFLRSL